MMVHLGMSGSLRLVDDGAARRKHDHIEMRLRQWCLSALPRPAAFWRLALVRQRFHQQLDHLGPEPLTEAFAGEATLCHSVAQA